ncbi:MAG: alanine racemase C-terminal domain-containing protein, partial [Spirochaetaceae bacterium]|nr:alanine racemase C-terminal domain-containing protein [Spirochaetaceae bacterium]
ADLTVDVSGIPEAQEGDEVLLLGRRERGPGDAGAAGPASGEIGVLELATWAGTNRNEIISAIGRRVPRAYLRGGEIVGSVDYLER